MYLFFFFFVGYVYLHLLRVFKIINKRGNHLDFSSR